MEIKLRLLGLCMANGGARREREVSGALSTLSLEAYTHLWSWVPALSVCASGFYLRSWARRAVFRLDCIVRSMHLVCVLIIYIFCYRFASYVLYRVKRKLL